MITKLIIFSLMVFVINIPFGYWRANLPKFSLQWFLAIHLPVPIIIVIRILASTGFAWYTYLFFGGAFFIGQLCGAYLLKTMKQRCNHTSSCLIMDLGRCFH